jgi:hypothetical protein
MESDLEILRSKLNGLVAVAIDMDDVARMLADIVAEGGGVYIEIDDATRFRLLRREGKFVLSKDSSRNRGSSFPPRR